MKLRMAVAMFGVTFAASVMTVAAHHSVKGTFDISKEIRIRGMVTQIAWINPHVRYWVDAINTDGTVSTWELELAPPNALRRTLGVDFIKPGDQVTVDLWQAKDGSRMANTLTLTDRGGRVVINSSRDTTNGWEMLPSSK